MWWLLLTFLFLLFQSAFSCSCVGKPIQSIFCNSDLVAVVTVQNETYKEKDSHVEEDELLLDGAPIISFPALTVLRSNRLEGHYLYDVDVEHVFVAALSARSALTSKTQIKTKADPGVCGQRLTVGKRLIITAKLGEDGIPTINSCNSIYEDFDQLTSFQIKGLEDYYRRSCDCEPDMNIFCEEGVICTDENTCPLLEGNGPDICYEKYSVCSRNKSGRCEWKQSKTFRECLDGKLDNL